MPIQFHVSIFYEHFVILSIIFFMETYIFWTNEDSKLPYWDVFD